MSDTDSFIEEVTEEVRKDRLYGYLRKYGWIAVTFVLIAVGAAGYLEWSKYQSTQKAQVLGDAMADALHAENLSDQIAALEALKDEAGSASVILALQKAALLVEDNQTAAAVTILETVAENTEIAQVYRDVATFKAVILKGDDLSPQERLAALEPLAAPGNAFRALALEQIAVAKLDTGDTQATIDQLNELLNEPNVSNIMRQRIVQFLVSLGGTLPSEDTGISAQ